MVKPIFNNKKKEKENEKEKSEEKQEENNIDFLSKKRAEPDTPMPDIDMVKLKKKVNEIMYSISKEENNSINELDILYESMSKNYLLNEFTSNCLNYINKIILDAPKNSLKKYQGIFELNKIFISIVKELLMNEFELLLLSLYLETLSISCQDLMSFKESLIFICFFIKKLTISEEKLSPINSFLIRKYQGFNDKFNIWVELNSSIFNKKLFFEYPEINERFKEFNKPHSIFCKNNYLDYNLIIDRILTMSIPYNENRNENIYLNKKANNINNQLSGYNNIFNNQLNFFPNNKNNQNYLINNDNINFNNNFNYLKNYVSSNISPYPGSLYFNQSNKNMNFDYSNILGSLNSLNNAQTSSNINNKDLINQNNQDIKKKGNIKFNVIKENNTTTISTTGKNETNELGNQKMIFVTKTQNEESFKNTFSNNENKDTKDININEIEKDKNILNKKVEKTIMANNLLYDIKPENSSEQNIQSQNNNQLNIFQQNNSNNGNIMNNNINFYPNNNAISLNTSRQMNDYAPLRYNTNLGINDINSPSQISFISLNNPLMADLNNLLNNPFQRNNFSQLLSHSNEDLEKNNFLSNNSINSSKNIFQNLSNYNLDNNNSQENENNNNNYFLINHLIGNTFLQNLNMIQLNNTNLNEANNGNSGNNGTN